MGRCATVLGPQRDGGDRPTFREVQGMVANRSEDPERWRGKCQLAAILHPHVRTPMSLEAVAELLCQMDCNNFAIWDDLLFTYAMGVYPTGALVNHSCAPTCVVMYDPATHVQTFRCLRDVAVGEEITHAYLDIALPRPLRRSKLHQQYQFQCVCPSCGEGLEDNRGDSQLPALDTPTVDETDREFMRAASARARGISFQYPAPESLRMLAEAYPVYRRRLPPEHVDRMSLTCHYLNLCLETSDWATALPLCEEVIKAYSRLYPPHHPMLGLQYCTLADIKDALHDRLGFSTDLKEAHRLLMISHGPENSLVQSIQSRLEEELRT
eukprot:GGOE01000333.1.p1 GENE.GGOE01000333.1~~GGOE01000333.1.p1  ORF type:complete len:325 (+),score=75.25 GGOE01000333.1:447-1421(+)